MTNKDALIAVLQLSVPDNALDKALLDLGIAGTDDYSTQNEMAIDQCAIEILQGLLSSQKITEGGYSVDYDRNAVMSRISYLCNKNGIVNPLRRVKGVSPW